ncbi:carnitine O-palmitoyltransferase 1, liver isoform-like [Lingula anatina]|uniref:Carnitine O-palmitoyltransferase 1, liver isoform-like n=1 Tax=Lingula anatina TaxID=7574 RepID=A0A1S3KAB7_LINAN|nr:carnitine O-palmitoyltransferase 1, liver isoform-like [Lingula anatina]|eukprot:XP_013419196.1 carnitine O-palmitoyltransferase 1, liver isoform-like [Lingula anatina]
MPDCIIWAVLVKFHLQQNRGPYKTFSLQNVLPRLPVPSLEQTCHKYLLSVKPLLTEAEYAQTKQVVEQFKQNEGPKLQGYLKLRAWNKVNWLSEWWNDLAYLYQRSPIAINSNYYCLDSEALPTNNPIARAANMIHYGVLFHDLIHTERLPVLLANGLVPVCMDGYRYMFNACRIPGLEKDTLHNFPASNFVIVIRKGMFFKLDVYAENKKGVLTPLTPWELQCQLEKIYEMSEEQDDGCGVAAFTAINRTQWAKHRQALIQASPVNKATLHEVERALWHISLDCGVPKDISDQAKMLLCGDGVNRWFDKSLVMFAFADGRSGALAEHATADATLFSRLWEYAQFRERYTKNGDVEKQEGETVRYLKPPKRLQWDVTGFEDSITSALAEHKANVDDLDMFVQPSDYGKGWIKKKHISPDGYLQMAMQLAYFRLHGDTPKTYESASTRMFALGRTETIRPISEHSVSFVKAMDNPSATSDTKINLLKKAVHYQTQYKIDATNGEGCDRHLLGLYCVSKELGMPVPSLYMDKAWQIPEQLSTSQTPTKITHQWSLETCSRGGGFGPVSPEGYGVSYIIVGEDLVNFHISSRKSCRATSSAKMAKAIVQAMADMRDLLV